MAEHYARERRRSPAQQRGATDLIAHAVPGRSTNTERLPAGSNGPYRGPTLRADQLPGVSAPTASSSTQQSADVDTKYTYRHKAEFDVHMGPVPAKLQIRLEASLKDKGSGHHGVPTQKGDVTWGSNQALLEHSAKGVDIKITTAVMKGSFDLLADGKLPGDLGTLPLVPRVEIKGLEAGLSLKNGADLKLMTLAVYVEGDFSKLFSDDVRAFAELKGQVRIECAASPELAKDIIKLARAADDIKRSAAVEAKLAKNEKWLSYYRKLGYKDKVAQLEGELTKLRKVRAAVSKARDVALEAIKKIGPSLEKSAGGRLLKKAVGKAFAVVFKKFLPLYNTLSTVQDIYEAGKWLASRDWGSIGDRIIDGGQGGTTFSDGSHDGSAGGGAGFGSGGSEDAADGVDPGEIERELQQEANPELHATAKAVVAVVQKKAGDGSPGVELSKEDKETLNFVIPADLTPDEIDAMNARLATASDKPQDLVTSVIEAVQEVRPFGQQRLGPSKRPTDEAPSQDIKSSGPESSTKPASPPAKATAHHQPEPPKKGNQPPRTLVVDPTETLLRVIRVDDQGNVVVPSQVQFPGFDAYVERTGVARYSFDTGEQGTEASFMVTVTIRPIEARAGMFLPDGRSIVARSALPNVMVIVRSHRPGT